MTIEINVLTSFFLLIEFNKIPTEFEHSLKFINENIIEINSFFQSELTSNFSIKFRIYADNDIKGGAIRAIYKGYKKIQSYKPFNYSKTGQDFDDFLNLNINFPKRIFERRKRKSYRKIEENIENAKFRRKSILEKNYKNNCAEYEKKLHDVLERKNTYQKQKHDKKIEGLDKFLKIKKKVRNLIKFKEIFKNGNFNNIFIT